MEFQAEVNDRVFKIEKDEKGMLINGKQIEFPITKKGNEYYIYREDRIDKVVILDKRPNDVLMLVNGKEITVSVKDHMNLMLERLGMNDLTDTGQSEIEAPMPGVILDVVASPGDNVKEGDPLLILEAMKMENVIKAPADAIVSEIVVEKGESVEKSAVLIRFE